MDRISHRTWRWGPHGRRTHFHHTGGEEQSVVPFARNSTLSARMERALGECMSESLKFKMYDALNVVKFFYDASQLQSSFMMLGCMMLGAGGICCMMLGTAKHHKI